MNLRSIFSAIAYKEIAQVDLPKRGSNQHEINGVAPLKQFFNLSNSRSEGDIQWFYFADDTEPSNSTSRYTFYDARARSHEKTHRTEWRLYYYGDFLSVGDVKDTLVLLKTIDGRIFGLIFQKKSTWLRAATNLFGISSAQTQLQLIPDKEITAQEITYPQQQLLHELGIADTLPTSANDELLAAQLLFEARRSKLTFPSTSYMSEIARQQANLGIEDSDQALIVWLTREEEIFRAIEKLLVQEKLTRGFDSVDDFVSYSLSVQNRRKSRMGYALQNHLEFLFKQHHLKFDAQKVTEGKNKPDFIFPGQREYHDLSFDVALLVMLGTKSSLKDRWRQILTEANRIPAKHLCTIDQTISSNQTNEIVSHKITLVLPKPIHALYDSNQRSRFLTIEDFINFIQVKQRGLQT